MTHSAYWTKRGPAPKFASPDDLWQACVKYFEFCEAEPLMEEKSASADGMPTTIQIRKMRAMTIAGLCSYIGIGKRTWHQWASGERKREDLAEVIERVETIMQAQKFEGAAAGLLNPVIIARDLGLTDKTEVTGKDGADLLPPMDPQDIGRRLAFALAAAVLPAPKN